MIESELITYINYRKKRIVGYYDHLKGNTDKKPFIIIPPPYGETKRNSLMISYYLVVNGFNVIRYDNTDHIGESDGDMYYSTMPKMKEDLISTLDYAEKRFGVSEFGIVARSLSARVAIKAATEDKRIKFILSLMGVVNLRYTLNAIYCEDIIGDTLRGKCKDFYNIFGFEVDSAFYKIAIQYNYHDFNSTLQDIKNLNIPLVFINAEKDPWIKISDVKKIIDMKYNSVSELHIIPEALHELYENPRAVKVALSQVVVSCTKYLYKRKIKSNTVVKPNLRDIAHQNHIEKQRLKNYELTKDDEKEFWSKYLNKYFMVRKLRDYQDYLDTINTLLGKIKEDEIILDAGCGPGHFGAWLLRCLIKYQLLNSPCIYVGIDFVNNAIKDAIINHWELKTIFYKRVNVNENLMDNIYVIEDLDNITSYKSPFINFRDNCFDKICCSLVISYVPDPLKIVKELFRVLKPRGKIVISSLKPYADLSEIYKNFVLETENEEDIEEARKLLNAAGKIKQKEGEGHYQFFSEKELKEIVIKAGGRNPKVVRTFANQANIIVAEK